MLRLLSSLWLSSSTDFARPTRARRVGESVPPPEFARRSWPSRLGDWLAASGWRLASIEPASFVGTACGDAIAAARLDFAEVLLDAPTAAAAEALDRIAATRRLHELWNLRAEVFGRVAERHGQGEAERRLAGLDRHFARRVRKGAARRQASGR
jgi:hypothetical protein